MADSLDSDMVVMRAEKLVQYLVMTMVVKMDAD